MIKITILIILVAFTIQHKRNDRSGHREQDHDEHVECSDYDQSQCEVNIGCSWSYDTKQVGCYPAIYTNLGNKRVLEQQVTFDHDSNCDVVIEDGDFIARQTFHHRQFRSFCDFWNVEQIFVNNRYFIDGGKLDIQEVGRYAIIYPAAPRGTAYLYSRKYFRGDSWVAKGPTKLNGQVIRSLALGPNTRVSLYNHQGQPLSGYQGLVRTQATEIINTVTYKVFKQVEEIRDADDVEYVLVETYLKP